MKDNKKNLMDIMDDVIQHIEEKRQEVTIAEQEPPKPEKVESLDDLTKGWEDAKAKAEEKPRFWDTTAKPLEKKEEVYSYFKRRIITGPYLCIILEHVFSVPHDVAYEVEADLIKGGFVPGHITLKDKIVAEVELWKRVIATCERDKIEGDFYEDAHHILRNRLSDMNIMNAMADQRELGIGENVVRQTCKGKKKHK